MKLSEFLVVLGFPATLYYFGDGDFKGWDLGWIPVLYLCFIFFFFSIGLIFDEMKEYEQSRGMRA